VRNKKANSEEKPPSEDRHIYGKEGDTTKPKYPMIIGPKSSPRPIEDSKMPAYSPLEGSESINTSEWEYKRPSDKPSIEADAKRPISEGLAHDMNIDKLSSAMPTGIVALPTNEIALEKKKKTSVLTIPTVPIRYPIMDGEIPFFVA